MAYSPLIYLRFTLRFTQKGLFGLITGQAFLLSDLLLA